MIPGAANESGASVDSAFRNAAEVVKAAVAALEAERWADVVPLVHPEALQRHRDTQVRWMVEMEQRAPRTPEELRAEQPWLSPEVASFYAEQERTHVTGGLPGMREQWGVASFRELEALSPAEFFVRYLSASSPPAKLRVALAESRNPIRDVATTFPAAAAAHRRRWAVLGEVVEGTGKAHVVYRERYGAGDDANEQAGDVRVTTLDYTHGRWWLRIDTSLLDQQGWSFVWTPESADSTPADG
jgi:hypothetical protein